MNRDEYAQMYALEDRHWWFTARRTLLSRALLRFLPRTPRRVLDLGCGTGGMLDCLHQQYGSSSTGGDTGAEIIGLDLEPVALHFSRQRGHRFLVQASATALPFPDNSFDAVVALDVLEHIPDHQSAAREIARVLAPGGMVFVTVPAYQSLWSGHDVALMHQRRYLAPEMGALLSDAGLSVRHLTYAVSMLLPVVWVIRRWQRRFRPNAPPRADAVPTPPLLNALLRQWLTLESHATLRGRVPCGLSVFAVAEKATLSRAAGLSIENAESQG